ncbi:MAG: LamG domain-containing protein [Gammaproteobacteria bacterium]|nr:LamG domain-containing protein [Gammaproteobacteria bacterium]MDH4253208.1 LamG domain-containing protein [Gammaproteobacteria bacterium]
MTNATGIAMAPVSTSPLARLRFALLGSVAALVIAACGGGAQTVENPVTNVAPPASYQGPPPATADIQSFKLNLWDNIQMGNRCGGCHNEQTGQLPLFARHDDVNLAYEAANTVANLGQPSDSRLVLKVGGGHNCWLTDSNACADIMTTWIENWAGSAGTGGRQIVLQPPPLLDPGSSKSYANATVGNFATLVHEPILLEYCAGCHSSSAPTSQQPYFAEGDANVAFEAAKSKMDLDDPASSRFVIRLGNEFHNCWDVGCAQAAGEMEAAILAFANTVPLTEVDPDLVISKALRLVDGTIASGGNRYENSQIALWEFKTGSGTVAFDTSGVEPAIDLNFFGEVAWFGGWGVTIGGGKLQGSTAASKKLYDMILATGEYSIEAWVIPANVTQEMARIVSYSAGDDARNFTLQQTLYNYEFRHRSTETSLNGDPQLSTPDADEVLQATLQHVVATYSPVEGRKIYVNGVLVTQLDPVAPGSMADWQDTFALVLGNEVSSDGLFQGTIRLAAIHNRALTPEQVVQNFDVGVGEKFFLLFSISDVIGVADSYILFEVAQFDTYGYLFAEPRFITLGSAPAVEGVPLEGMYIGVNGAESPVGQSYGNLIATLSSSAFGEMGQALSALGAVLPLEKGPQDDEFFLSFDRLGDQTHVRVGDPSLVVIESDILPRAQRIGVRTFDEINATMAAVTGVDPETPAVDMTFQNLRQSLPAIENPQAFLSSHQVAIAQLAIEYCNALVDGPQAASFFGGFNFGLAPSVAYAGTARNQVIDPLIDRFVGVGIQDQPDFVDIRDELGYFATDGVRPDNLIDRLLVSADNPDTRAIAKAACASVLGSAAMLVQ